MSDFNESTDIADLDWQAFRYVSGEMDQEELALFEERLAEDCHACEAVSTAFLLGDVIVDAFASDPVSTVVSTDRVTKNRPRAAAWISVAVALIAVSAAMFLPLRNDVPDESVAANASAEHAREMVRLWTDSSVDAIADGSEQTAIEPELPELIEELQTNVPDWLLVAVEIENGESGILDEPEVLEN